MKINFISNLPSDLRTGGFSAMNAAAFHAIGKSHELITAGPIDPPPNLRQKLASKLLRAAGWPGNYSFFSEHRLRKIASLAAASCTAGTDLDFFHGFTPWIATRPPRPYAAWSDCNFRDYIDHYHRRADFRAADLERIERREAEWLRGASAIGFTSDWAAQRSIVDYGLDPARVHVLGIFGEIELPEADVYSGSQQFAFVSTDFAAKGGWIALAAFRQLRARHPGASLIIVGNAPPGLAGEPGVTVAGYLRKEVPDENRRLRDILAASCAVVHPTRSDIAPLLLVEAGYFGCPAISTRRFAIGEIVQDGETGILVDDAQDAAAIASAMAKMLDADRVDTHAMRRAAWAHTREALGKHRFEQRLLAMIQSALPAVS